MLDEEDEEDEEEVEEEDQVAFSEGAGECVLNSNEYVLNSNFS